MTIILKTDKSKSIFLAEIKKLNKKIDQLSIKKGFDPTAFVGKVTCYGNALTYQKKMRAEW